MAQAITPELEALLVDKLQVGDKKHRAEVEIDERTGGSSPLLGGSSSSSGGNTDSFQLPTVDVAGDDVLLLSFVQIRPIEAITLAAGWSEREAVENAAIGAGGKRWQLSQRYVATADGPYEDTYTTPDPTSWGVMQFAFRANGPTQPTNGGTFHELYQTGGAPCVNAPAEAVTLDSTPTAGHVLVGWISPSGCHPNDWNTDLSDRGWQIPDGWTELIDIAASGMVSEGVVIFKVAEGDESTITGFGTTREDVAALTVIVVELDIDATALPTVVTHVLQVATVATDRSRKMAAAQLDATFENEDGGKGWYTQGSPIFVPNNPIRAFAWYGDRANRVRIFTGLVDRHAEHRNPKSIAIKARSRMKWLLEQGFVATGPQAADEEGAIRTEDNGVYLDKTIEYIVGDILDRAGWPAADRSIATTGVTLSEYLLADKGSWFDQIAGADRLTTAAGCDLVEDELGIATFQPSPLVAAVEPTPAWDFAAGVNVLALDHEADDEGRVTRVEVSGPMTSAVPKWAQVWSTSKLDHPAGVWYDPADPDHIRVVDRVTKYIYRMRQSDRAIISKKYLGGYPLGLSGDPTDATHYFVLNAPWRNTGSTSGNSVKRYRKSDNALLNTYSLPNGRWSDLKTDGTNLWLTNYDDGKLYKRSMTAAAVSSHPITYAGELQDKATGMWLLGTEIGLFFSAHKRFLIVDVSAPGTVTGVQSTKGTRIAGGERDSDTGIDLYAVAGAGSFGLTSGMVAKFTLAELVTNDVTALAVDWDLEDALGVQSGIADREHVDCPNNASPHPFEARLATYAMKVVQSLEQAGDVADAQLALLSRLRRVLDLATTGHPATQINDPISYTDAVAGIASTWVIDSYRKRIAETYTQTMSVLPWEAP